MTREESLVKVRGYLTDLLPIEDYDEVEEIMSALEQEPKWIPVSERLPEKEINCLVTDSLGKVHKVTFYHALDGRESYFSGCYCVIAWMPLPLPWKGE